MVIFVFEPFHIHPKVQQPMKKIFPRLFKVLGLLLLFLAVVLGVVAYRSIKYPTFSLRVDPQHFPEVQTAADLDSLAKLLLAEMSFEEKVDQMYGEKFFQAPKFLLNVLARKRFPHVYVGGNERLHLPPWVLSDGPRGARVLKAGVNSVTTFPVAMARGASWDPDLERQINEAIAIEMRANETNYAATPCINLLRHPAWGRAQETYGEDPWLLGELGLAAVRGLEKHRVMACPKHFALNSLENSRFVVDVKADERTLREVYLPHFKKVIQQGKPASLMSAYNKVNGAYCGENEYLLEQILRREWGFEGFVSSDWVAGTHDGVASVRAGLDVEMPWQQAYTYDALQRGLDDGAITEAQLDRLVLRSLQTRLPYAFAEDIQSYDETQLKKPAHVELARRAAEESMVLLKNESVLPFSAESGKTIAVIGALADLENTGDHGSSDATAPYVVTPYEGLRQYHAERGNEVLLDTGSDLAAAQRLAKRADQVVVVVGYTFEEEGEYIQFDQEAIRASAEAGRLVGSKGTGGDRIRLQLLERDEELIRGLAPLNEQLVVVYVGGSAIDLSGWVAEVPAVLFAWYAGMEGGNALARILYGAVNPSGKLPFSIARDPAHYPPFQAYTTSIDYGYYHGYTLLDKKGLEAAYPFGFGKSYTTFSLAEAVLTPEEHQLGIRVLVRNDGARAGAEVVQAYVGFPGSAVDRPVKLLRAFEKVALAAGAQRELQLYIPYEDLTWYNPERGAWELEELDYELYLGTSSAREDLQLFNFRLPIPE